MTTNPKARKAPAKAAPSESEPKWLPPPHGGIIVTVQQRDDLNDTIHLLHAVELAVLGSELDDFEQCALCNLVRVASSRLKALSSDFDALAEAIP
jgi:hypothetical protein